MRNLQSQNVNEKSNSVAFRTAGAMQINDVTPDSEREIGVAEKRPRFSHSSFNSRASGDSLQRKTPSRTASEYHTGPCWFLSSNWTLRINRVDLTSMHSQNTESCYWLQSSFQIAFQQQQHCSFRWISPVIRMKTKEDKILGALYGKGFQHFWIKITFWSGFSFNKHNQFARDSDVTLKQDFVTSALCSAHTFEFTATDV